MTRNSARRALALGLLAFALASPTFADDGVSILEPNPDFAALWQNQTFPFIRATAYTYAKTDERPAIRALGRKSASGLGREIEIPLGAHPWLEWTWRVERAPASAELDSDRADDFAAGIIVLFGKPGRDVPALAYVWTGGSDPAGSMVPSPRRPALGRNLVLRDATDARGRWVMERRDVAADYARAFGRPAPGPIRAVVLFTDNDQTGEPVEAFYGAIRALPR